MPDYKNLVIVESPAKAKTIEKYLGKNYKVVASKGHLRDLPKSKLGIDISNNFEPYYISIRGKGSLISELKKYASKATKVYLASDPDREGEAIAWHLSKLLGLNENDKIRVEFNEITKDAVKDAFKSPRAINMNLVDAQQARRVLDRLVGYSISPILWKKVKKGLSAGRVQSVALKLVIDREKEIKQFKPEEYWELNQSFIKDKVVFESSLYSVNHKKVVLKTKEDVENVQKLLTNNEYKVTKLVNSVRNRKPALPFTTSSLQQEAVRKLNFRTGRTMAIAQQLYEGISLGRQGTVGLITYMRTDSTRISDVAKKEAQQFITEEYGSEYVATNTTVKNTSSSQDAHEAIRPTSVIRTPSSIEKYLTKDQLKLYSLIWSRFVSSQMSNAIYHVVKAEIEQNNVQFKSTGSTIKFQGFLKVYEESNDDVKKNKENRLPELNQEDIVFSKEIKPSQHFTQPPARYSEATLIKELEELGVGRPSTYAPTLETLQKRYYVKLVSKRFESTELGEIVNHLIEEFFPNIVNVKFTAMMEHDLDSIEESNRVWQDVVRDFYDPFAVYLKKAEENIEKIEIKDELAGFNCPECGNDIVIKVGKFGKFYACSNFPDCRYTQPIVKKIDVICPKCHQGDIIERKSKNKKIFYGCTNYPECDFVSWDKPIGRVCPKDDTHYLVEKKVRGGKQVVCTQCDYKEDILK